MALVALMVAVVAVLPVMVVALAVGLATSIIIR